MKATQFIFNLAAVMLLCCTVPVARTLCHTDFGAVCATPEVPVDNDDESGACNGIKEGKAAFAPNSSKIPSATMAALDALSRQMSFGPSCKVVISGNGGGSKVEQQLSWDRVNAVIEYMSEKNNIDRNRFIFQYQSAEPGKNEVLFRAAAEGEDGPASVPPPHPDLSR